ESQYKARLTVAFRFFKHGRADRERLARSPFWMRARGDYDTNKMKGQVSATMWYQWSCPAPEKISCFQPLGSIAIAEVWEGDLPGYRFHRNSVGEIKSNVARRRSHGCQGTIVEDGGCSVRGASLRKLTMIGGRLPKSGIWD